MSAAREVARALSVKALIGYLDRYGTGVAIELPVTQARRPGFGEAGDSCVSVPLIDVVVAKLLELSSRLDSANRLIESVHIAIEAVPGGSIRGVDLPLPAAPSKEVKE